VTSDRSLAEAEAARAAAERRLADEQRKTRQAVPLTDKLNRLEEENHLAYLFRQAFTGQ